MINARFGDVLKAGDGVLIKNLLKAYGKLWVHV
jgi:hypothetical protein